MSLVNFYESVQAQKAVYWGEPVDDGYGGQMFSVAKVIKCRWSERVELIRTFNGQEVVSRAKIMVSEDLDILGHLKLLDATIEDGTNPLSPNYWSPPAAILVMNNGKTKFQDDARNDPDGFAKAFPIVSFRKTPLYKSDREFIRSVFV